MTQRQRITEDQLARMEADLSAWKAEERELSLSETVDISRTLQLEDVPMRENGKPFSTPDGTFCFSVPSAIAWVRLMIRPGDGDSTPAQALATLRKLVDVLDTDSALSALRFERGAMRREQTLHGYAMDKLETADGYREHKRKRYRTRANLTQQPS